MLLIRNKINAIPIIEYPTNIGFIDLIRKTEKDIEIKKMPIITYLKMYIFSIVSILKREINKYTVM